MQAASFLDFVLDQATSLDDEQDTQMSHSRQQELHSSLNQRLNLTPQNDSIPIEVPPNVTILQPSRTQDRATPLTAMKQGGSLLYH
jgi:hypothetical protein